MTQMGKQFIPVARPQGVLADFINPKGVHMEKFFLDKNNTAIVIIDIQERLAAVMKMKDAVISNCLISSNLRKCLLSPSF